MNDFIDVVERYGIPYRLTSSEEVRINCFNCDDYRFHLYVNQDKEVFQCFRCQKRGTLRSLIYSLSKQVGERIEYHFKTVKFSPPREPEVTAGPDRQVPPPPGYYRLADQQGRRWKEAIEYLSRRGITPEQIEDYEIGFTNVGKYSGRIIFPIHYHGDVVSWVARSIDSNPRYRVLNPSLSEASPPSHFLYNFDTASYFPRVVITEGVFDCLSVRPESGVYCPVATFGKKLTPQQVDLLLSQRFEEVIFCWDSDAVKEMLEYSKELAGFVPVRIGVIPSGKDPNDAGHQVMEEVIRTARKPDLIHSMNWLRKPVAIGEVGLF